MVPFSNACPTMSSAGISSPFITSMVSLPDANASFVPRYACSFRPFTMAFCRAGILPAVPFPPAAPFVVPVAVPLLPAVPVPAVPAGARVVTVCSAAYFSM